jgi:hypothetical protein
MRHWVVGATFGQINLPQLYSHTGGDLHSGVSELWQYVLVDLSDWQPGLLTVLQMW